MKRVRVETFRNSARRLRLGDHRRAQVDAGDDAAASGEHRAPTSNAATDIEHARAGLDVEPGSQRQVLTPMNHPVVELRHAIRAHRRESGPFGGEPTCAILPIVMGQVLFGRRCAARVHEAFRMRLVFSSSGSVVLALGSGS